MVDRPILFSTPMIRALLAGTKSQTRRLIKPQPPEGITSHCWYQAPKYGFALSDRPTTDWHIVRLLAQADDRLWVKEAWRTLQSSDCLAPRHLAEDRSKITYEADTENRNPLWAFGRLRASMHMPRWASRLTLIVTDVRVQKLQDISEEDADAECFGGNFPSEVLPEVFPGDREQYGHLSMAQCYGRLWNHINGDGAWESNPWVVAYSFTVHRCNIDQMEGANG